MREALAWLAIFALAFGLRLAVTGAFVGLDAAPDAAASTDQVAYEELAHQVASGRGYRLENGEPTALRPPGTSLALAAAYAVAGRDYAAGRVWFCLLGALTCLLVASFARQAFGRTAALGAALYLALYPGHFYYSMHFLSEPVFGFAATAFCAASLAGMRRGSWPASAVAGLALGFTCLTRPQALLFLPIGWTPLLSVPRLRVRRTLAQAALQSTVAVIVLAPWVARNAALLGEPVLSLNAGNTFWGAHNELVAADSDLRGSWVPVDVLVDEEHPLPEGEVARDAAA